MNAHLTALLGSVSSFTSSFITSCTALYGGGEGGDYYYYYYYVCVWGGGGGGVCMCVTV